MIKDRLPFATCIADPKLMGRIWKDLSVPQQTILLAAYGLDLPSDAHRAAWSILNDNVKYDELYFPTAIIPTDYEPTEYDTVVGLIGRRSGKSYVSCFAALYEIIFGGHVSRVKEGQQIIVPYVAQDIETAKINMATIVILAKEAKLDSQIKQAHPKFITFKNGITVVPEPPTIKTGRGVAIPVAILDEVGFWYKTSENANPDFEVKRAITPAMAQFHPYGKMFVISSPYTEEGILWEASKAGTSGRNATHDDKRKAYNRTLVMQASTGAMSNPALIGVREFLEKESVSDPEAFIREYGARFVTAISGYLPAALVQAATDAGVSERSRKELEKTHAIPFYVAAMDPAHRHDSWAFTICHRDQYGRVVQDVLKVWKPNKKAGIVLNPAEILAEIAAICSEWRIKHIFSDMTHLESLQQIALGLKLTISEVSMAGRRKQEIFGSFKQMLLQGNIRLLDIPEQYQQLVQLQKKLGAQGLVQISAPPNRHDDIACALVMAINQSLTAYPKFAVQKKVPTIFDEGIEQIRRKRILAETDGVWL